MAVLVVGEVVVEVVGAVLMLVVGEVVGEVVGAVLVLVVTRARKGAG